MSMEKLETDVRRLFGEHIKRLTKSEETGFMEIELSERCVLSADKMATLVMASLKYKIDVQVYPVDADHLNIYMEWRP